MKGIVFNLLETAVADEHGDDTWDDLVDAAGVSGSYTSLGTYDDAEMSALVGAASTALGTSRADVLRWFGERAIPQMAAAYPEFFTPHRATIPFLLTLNDIIHPEVRKLVPGADVPDFDCARPAPEVLEMTYRSARSLCALAEGMVLGAATHYGEAVEISQPRCVHAGEPVCVLRIRVTGPAA